MKIANETPLPLVAARAYAASGWRVFPCYWPVISAKDDGEILCACGRTKCSSVAKHPLCEHGVLDATSDPTTIGRWWVKWPIANVAIATGGQHEGWHLVVLDIDPRHGGDESLARLCAHHGPLPDTVVGRTGGGGLHYFFRQQNPAPCIIGLVAGIDIRGSGGYVLAPPSRHASGRIYSFVNSIMEPISQTPEWLAALIAAHRHRHGRRDGGGGDHKASGTSELLLREGERNATLASLAGSVRRKGAAYEAVLAYVSAENFARCSPPLEPREVEQIVRSIMRYPPGGESAQNGRAASEVKRRGNVENGSSRAAEEEQAPDATPHGQRDRVSVIVDESWRDLLVRRRTGKDGASVVAATNANVTTILTHHPEWCGVLAYDAFGEWIASTRVPPAREWERVPGKQAGQWTEGDSVRLGCWLASNEQLSVTMTIIWPGVLAAAEKNCIHPVRDYLARVASAWDGEPRVASLAAAYFGAEPTQAHNEILRRWLISAVARVMDPGCQVDHTLILEGVQGVGKTSVLRALVPERKWYSDTNVIVGEKDSYQALHGIWIFSFDELDSLRGVELTRTKTFLASTHDHYRPSYGRVTCTFARQNVFAATTNETEYLRDSTGNRRFWPVEISTRPNVDALARDRDQIWAEAYQQYKAGQSWHVDSAVLSVALDEAQESRRVHDPWEERIAKWLARDPRRAHDGVTTGQCFEAVGLDAGRQTRGDEMRMGRVLRTLGHTRVRVRICQDREWRFIRYTT